MVNKVTYEIHRQSLSEQVYHYIKRLILSGEILVGKEFRGKGCPAIRCEPDAHPGKP